MTFALTTTIQHQVTQEVRYRRTFVLRSTACVGSNNDLLGMLAYGILRSIIELVWSEWSPSPCGLVRSDVTVPVTLLCRFSQTY